jgi:hypothetical protein
MKVQRWIPDTCSCIIEFKWDNVNPQPTKTMLKACSLHKNADEVHKENISKNIAIGHLAREMKIDPINILFTRVGDRFELSCTEKIPDSVKAKVNGIFKVHGLKHIVNG